MYLFFIVRLSYAPWRQQPTVIFLGNSELLLQRNSAQIDIIAIRWSKLESKFRNVGGGSVMDQREGLQFDISWKLGLHMRNIILVSEKCSDYSVTSKWHRFSTQKQFSWLTWLDYCTLSRLTRDSHQKKYYKISAKFCIETVSYTHLTLPTIYSV